MVTRAPSADMPCRQRWLHILRETTVQNCLGSLATCAHRRNERKTPFNCSSQAAYHPYVIVD